MKKIILLIALLSVFALGQSKSMVDWNNSWVHGMSANATFTGSCNELIDNYVGVTVNVVATAGSASGGLKIQQSSNGADFYTTDSCSVAANKLTYIYSPSKARYYRIKYVNGADSAVKVSIQAIIHLEYVGYLSKDSLQVYNSIPQTVKISDSLKVYFSNNKTVNTNKLFEAQDLSVTLDSMNNSDTLKIHYFNNNYMDCFITLFDTTATTDTFYVERYDTLSPYGTKLWTSAQVGFVDMGTGSYTSSVTGKYQTGANVIIPGSGLTKTYYIAEPRPGTYRVWVPSYVVNNNKKRYVKWSGKNR